MTTVGGPLSGLIVFRLAGRTLAEAGLPPGVLVISVTHDGETILRGFLEARTGRGYRGSAEGQP